MNSKWSFLWIFKKKGYQSAFKQQQQSQQRTLYTSLVKLTSNIAVVNPWLTKGVNSIIMICRTTLHRAHTHWYIYDPHSTSYTRIFNLYTIFFFFLSQRKVKILWNHDLFYRHYKFREKIDLDFNSLLLIDFFCLREIYLNKCCFWMF